jgi:hypothetical protein
MRLILTGLVVALAPALTVALPAAALAQAQAPAPTRLSPADQAAAFAAAGFKRVGRQWRGCDDPGAAGYAPGAIETTLDIDGDTRPDAVITEGSAYCFGQDGQGYALVSKQADGRWKPITQGSGVLTILRRRAGATSGWPDIEIGGPGFCFPVQRWNGREYVQNRFQYQGKTCRPR